MRRDVSVLDDIGDLSRLVDNKPRIMIRARLTRAAVLLTNASDYRAALSEFQACAADSKATDDHLAYAMANKGIGDVSRAWASASKQKKRMKTLLQRSVDMVLSFWLLLRRTTWPY